MGLREAADLTKLLKHPAFATETLESAALLAAPLLVPHGVVGAFLVGRGRDVPFGPDDLQLLASVATQVAAAFENARLREEEKAREDHDRVYIRY